MPQHITSCFLYPDGVLAAHLGFLSFFSSPWPLMPRRWPQHDNSVCPGIRKGQVCCSSWAWSKHILTFSPGKPGSIFLSLLHIFVELLIKEYRLWFSRWLYGLPQLAITKEWSLIASSLQSFWYSLAVSGLQPGVGFLHPAGVWSSHHHPPVL